MSNSWLSRREKSPCQFLGCKYSHHCGLQATKVTFTEVSQEEMPETWLLPSLSGTPVTCAARWLCCTFPPGSPWPRLGEKGHLVPTLSASSCPVGSQPRAHAIVCGSSGVGRECGGLAVGCPFCVSLCPLQLGTPRGQKPPLLPILAQSLHPLTLPSAQNTRLGASMNS